MPAAGKSSASVFSGTLIQHEKRKLAFRDPAILDRAFKGEL
jgi:hypothetical protein